MRPLQIFVGYDQREPLAYSVFAHSIYSRSTIPVAIIPLVQGMLRRQFVYSREADAGAATEFSLTRFLVPYLSGYSGLSVFADCDMVMKGDIAEMPLTLAGPKGEPRITTLGAVWEHETAFDLGRSPSAWCCQHDYVPRATSKMDGQTQASYPRKNWSSFMLFNNQRCTALAPKYVNAASPADLHRFTWADDVGEIPLAWNWLVGEYAENSDAKNLHYTLGGPWFAGLEHCEHAADWYAARDAMMGASQLVAA